MSRQRNVENLERHSEYPVSESDDFKPAFSKHKSSDFGILRLGDGFDLIGSFVTFVKFLVESVYSFLPFVIILYLLQVYRTPIQESLYYPNFPNSFHEASVAELNDINVEFYDLADYAGTATGWQNNERILFLVPLRDASAHLPLFFSHMANLTYPHHLIDMSFLISDTSDSTLDDLKTFLTKFQSDPDKSKRFGRIEIFEKDFGQIVGQSFSDRHGFAAQGPRRKKMAIARNWLLATALRPDHSWVYWRDIDVETCPATILEDLMHHNKDVIVPNIWRPLPDWLGYEQAYDLNSWQESEGGIELAERLDEDAVIVEGYPEYATWRPHLAYLRDPYGDPEVEIELDGIGGVSILSKAHVFRHGAMFPAFSFKKHAETEAFGKLCKTMGFEVIGLPHYVIWHIYEPSTDDLKHMEWLANEEVRAKERMKNKVVFDRAWKVAFEDVSENWELEKFNVFKNTDLSSLRLGQAHWDEVDEYLTEIDDDEYSEEDGDQHEDSAFVMNFNAEKNKMFEENVMAQLKKGPVVFGDSRNEYIFDNFNDLEGSQKRKKLKFKKFEEVVKTPTDTPDTTETEYIYNEDLHQLKGKYDLASDRVIKAADSKKSISDQTINDDKQLFNDLENNKSELDGEEEGGVEFKQQQTVEEAEANAKLQKEELQRKNAKKSQDMVIKTFYEIDDAGVTVGTLVQTVKATPTPLGQNSQNHVTEEILDLEEEERNLQELIAARKKFLERKKKLAQEAKEEKSPEKGEEALKVDGDLEL